MKYIKKTVIILFIAISMPIFSQSKPVLYFCQDYTENGEIGISDRFTTGSIVLMLKSSNSISASKIKIQFEKLDSTGTSFKFYKKFYYSIDPKLKFVFFRKSKKNDLSFDEPGIYRVFILNHENKNISSALVEIIDDN